MKRYVMGIALAALAAGVLISGCRGEQGEAAPRGGVDSARVAVLGPADAGVVTRVDLVAGVPVSGTLEPAVDIRIAAPLPEVLDAVLVKEGQAVRRGQVLARFRAGTVTAASASADAQRRLAASDYERMQNLYKEGAVAQRDVENAEVALRAAEAAAAQATERLEQATVRAPSSGVIATRAVEAGDRVKDGDQLFRLVNTTELEFAAAVPSEYVGQVRVGSPVVVEVVGRGEAGPGLSGRVSRVNPTADPATRQVRVYVTVPNTGARLVGGLFASGRVVLAQVRGALAVPTPAVRRDANGKTYVLIVADGRVARRDVTTGLQDEVRDLVEIPTGLAGGETVVIGPIEGLQVGQPAQVVGREG